MKGDIRVMGVRAHVLRYNYVFYPGLGISHCCKLKNAAKSIAPNEEILLQSMCVMLIWMRKLNGRWEIATLVEKR